MTLRTHDDGAVRTLTLDREEKRNALDPTLLQTLLDALEDAAQDDAVRCVVLASEGPVFCAGGDLEDMRKRQGDAMATRQRQREGFGALARALLTHPKPVVSRVQGPAVGAGAMLVLCTDVPVLSTEASLRVAFHKVALIPDTGGTWLLPRLLGLRRARELALLGGTLEAEAARDLGLVHDAVDPGNLDATVDALAEQLAEGPTETYRLAKEALLRGSVSTLDDALTFEASAQGFCFTLEDHAEAVDAFFQDRDPEFAGR